MRRWRTFIGRQSRKLVSRSYGLLMTIMESPIRLIFFSLALAPAIDHVPDFGLTLRPQTRTISDGLRLWSRTTGQAASSSGHRNGLIASKRCRGREAEARFRQIVRPLQLLRGIGNGDGQPITRGTTNSGLRHWKAAARREKRSKREIEHLSKPTLGLGQNSGN